MTTKRQVADDEDDGLDGRELLVAASGVSRAGPLDRLVNGVLGWFA